VLLEQCLRLRRVDRSPFHHDRYFYAVARGVEELSRSFHVHAREFSDEPKGAGAKFTVGGNDVNH
jgi:hypothetical protein